MIIVTNAVDSYVAKKKGTGTGECKIYIRKNHTDEEYREFFQIDGNLYGRDKYDYNGDHSYRPRGPLNNCFISVSNLAVYFEEIKHLMPHYQLEDCKNFLDQSIDTILTFTINYTYDSQERSYVGSKDDPLSLLRLFSVSNKTLITIEKHENERIEFSLCTGHLK